MVRAGEMDVQGIEIPDEVGAGEADEVALLSGRLRVGEEVPDQILDRIESGDLCAVDRIVDVGQRDQDLKGFHRKVGVRIDSTHLFQEYHWKLLNSTSVTIYRSRPPSRDLKKGLMFERSFKLGLFITINKNYHRLPAYRSILVLVLDLRIKRTVLTSDIGPTSRLTLLTEGRRSSLFFGCFDLTKANSR